MYIDFSNYSALRTKSCKGTSKFPNNKIFSLHFIYKIYITALFTNLRSLDS